MSCWIVDRRHIDLLSLLIAGEVEHTFDRDRLNAIGAALIRENNASHSYRYEARYDDEHPDPDGYCWEDPALGSRMEDPYFLLKQIDCYEYQACEHPGFYTTTVWNWLDWLRELIIARMPVRHWEGRTTRSGDPASYVDTRQWDEQPWGIDDRTAPRRDGLADCPDCQAKGRIFDPESGWMRRCLTCDGTGDVHPQAA